MLALITGITGQDGFYLTEYLLSLGYDIVGMVRRKSDFVHNNTRLKYLEGDTSKVRLIEGDITDPSSMRRICRYNKFDEVYHLAAQSNVGISWENPMATSKITGLGTLNILDAVLMERPNAKVYFAGSSEQFGNSLTSEHALNEESPMKPESPYAVAKVYGYNISKVYRKSYGLFVACGILFNHESPLRGLDFVTRKITNTLALIKAGKKDILELGNIDAYRDWGYAGDYVKSMHLMLQQEEPDDYVIATGESHSVRYFLEEACDYFDLDVDKVCKINNDLYRPADVRALVGDYSKANKKLGWAPECTLAQLIVKMCQYDRVLSRI